MHRAVVRGDDGVGAFLLQVGHRCGLGVVLHCRRLCQQVGGHNGENPGAPGGWQVEIVGRSEGHQVALLVVDAVGHASTQRQPLPVAVECRLVGEAQCDIEFIGRPHGESLEIAPHRVLLIGIGAGVVGHHQFYALDLLWLRQWRCGCGAVDFHQAGAVVECLPADALHALRQHHRAQRVAAVESPVAHPGGAVGQGDGGDGGALQHVRAHCFQAHGQCDVVQCCGLCKGGLPDAGHLVAHLHFGHRRGEKGAVVNGRHGIVSLVVEDRFGDDHHPVVEVVAGSIGFCHHCHAVGAVDAVGQTSRFERLRSGYRCGHCQRDV